MSFILRNRLWIVLLVGLLSIGLATQVRNLRIVIDPNAAFALALMVDKSILAPVLCNPSLPFAITPDRKRDLGVDAETLRLAKTRSAADGVCVLGMRFTKDIAVPQERFKRLRDEFGDRFMAIEIDSSPGNGL